MLRPCPPVADVPVVALDAMPLAAQVDWWREWSVEMVGRHATCAGRVDLWIGWWDAARLAQ